MARALLCDICKKPTDEIVGKMFYTPMLPGGTGAKSFHNGYQFHLDVGICCEGRLKSGFNWRKRMSSKEYNSSRRRKPK